MSTDRELEESFQALIEQSRRKLGAPPSSEELAAYLHGEISGENADRIQEHLACDPATLDRLLDLAAHVGHMEEPDHLSDEELDEDWEAIRSRLRLKNTTVVPFSSRAKRQWAERLVAIAAVLVVAVLGMRTWNLNQQVDDLSRRLTEPQVNVARYELLPDGRRGGPAEEPPIQISLDEGGAHLIFALFDMRSFHSYRLEIHDAHSPEESSVPLWSTDKIVQDDDNTFALGLPPGSLPRGDYLFRLYGVGGEEEDLLASYSVRF